MGRRGGACWVGVAFAVVAALSGCGSSDETDRGSDGSATTTIPEPIPTLPDGLRVPVGAELAGVIHDPRPSAPDGGATPWTAYLVVTRDPYAAWDDLAAQVRSAGAPLSGSADACLYTLVDPPPREDVPGPGAPIGVPADGAPPVKSDQDAYNRAEREQFETLLVDGGTLPEGADGVDCFAVAETDRDGLRATWTVNLTAAVDVPATLQVEARSAPPGTEPARSTAAVTSTLRQLQGKEQVLRDPRPDAVPEGSAALLPQIAPQPELDPGDAFGTEVNCFDAGYERFVLPAGTRLLGDGFDGRTGSVLALEDPEGLDAVLDDLHDQAAGPTPSEDFQAVRRDLPLADGSEVASLDLFVEGGGGACTVLASPDRTRLVLLRYAD